MKDQIRLPYVWSTWSMGTLKGCKAKRRVVLHTQMGAARAMPCLVHHNKKSSI